MALCVTGATYAYFALTASNSSITSTVGKTTLTLTVDKIAPTTQTTNMVSQLESTLGDAISDSYNCVDERNNVICHVYKATITNGNQATVELKGLISFELVNPKEGETLETNFPNLRWKRITDATTLSTKDSNSALKEGIFEEGKVFNPSETKEYYFVVWVNETGDKQNDHGVFKVNINFKALDGDGLTSTIRPKISTAEVGSYIAYTGNNGCPEGHCDGTNANYVDDTNMGYCFDPSYKFTENGWRIMAKDAGGVYLVSAGAPECICTSNDGTSSNDSCSIPVDSNNMELYYINTLNNHAIKYCNPLYAKGGVCNATTAWAMADADYQKLTGSTLDTCKYNSNESCGLNNTLIDNGGYYWYATRYSSTSSVALYWNPKFTGVYDRSSMNVMGIRPVLYLESDISIVGGSGTSEDPYQLENRKKVLSDVEVGSYIAYTGTNGCPEGHCDGTNANYVDDTDMGYCSSSSYKFTENGWRVMSKDSGGVYIVSAGAPECMCTNSDGTISNSSCDTYVSANDIDLHIINLNNQSRKYCNPLYAKGGVCNETTAWAMDDADYQKVTGSTLRACSGNSNESCGLNNFLIDNGGLYWYATQYPSSARAFRWYPYSRYVFYNSSNYVYGVRPVLYLESSISIVGGSGTYGDPYQLSTD